MELGLCEQDPFRGRPSWAERMIRLRDRLGPFRLAYLEAILRAADMRVSREAELSGQESPQGKEAAS
jgi:CRISPR-associated endonuclease/helicase Cas3